MIASSIAKSIAKPVASSVGVSGGGVAFSPAGITGLVNWWDASDPDQVLNSTAPDVPATNGQTVIRVNDKATGVNFLASAGTPPTLQTTAFGTKQALYFDGTGDLLAGILGVGASTASTLFVVFKPDADDTAFVVFGDSSKTQYFLVGESGSATVESSGIDPDYRKNGAAVGWATRNDVYVGCTGASCVITAKNCNFTSWSKSASAFELCGYGSGFEMKGLLAEVLIYNSALSAGDITQVETYLLAKYGIS